MSCEDFCLIALQVSFYEFYLFYFCIAAFSVGPGLFDPLFSRPETGEADFVQV